MSLRRLRVWIVSMCVAALLLAQLSGAHYHRHIGVATGPEAGTTVHLRDAGMHVAIGDVDHDHHGAADRAEHPGVDLEIRSTATAAVKVFKSALLLGLLLAFVLWLVLPPRGVAARPPSGAPLRPRPRPFLLLPPSHAPPLLLSRI